MVTRAIYVEVFTFSHVFLQDEDKSSSVPATSFEENQQVNETNNSGQSAVKKPAVQPTSTQIMLAQLIGGDNMDELQRNKIQQVMDITGKPEDAVATALFDAAWDINRAVELLLEDGDNLNAWEEQGKRGKKKQKQSAEEGKVSVYLDVDNSGFFFCPLSEKLRAGEN